MQKVRSYFYSTPLTLLVNVCRMVVGLTFIFSGFVKAIDPLGTQYKLIDYLDAMTLGGILPDWMLLIVSVLLSGLEFCIGVFMTFAIARRVTSRVALAFMIAMTALTVWIALADPVEDCGCFGDAVTLSNWQTLYKNIVLLACTVAIAMWPLRISRWLTDNNQWIVVHFTMLFTLAVSVWCLYYLPLFDFRPYRIGTNVVRDMQIPDDAEQPEFETTFILEKDGVQREFSMDDYPDSTWTFIDSKSRMTKRGFVPPIHDLSITATTDTEEYAAGDDITDMVLAHPGYTFLIVAPFLEKADDSNFGIIDGLYEYALDNGYAFYCLTASGKKGIEHWRDITGAEYPFCITDGTTLKTIIRSNPGVVLMKDSVIVGKWSHNDLPSIEQLNGPIEKASWAKTESDSALWRIARVLLAFFVPLILLVIADRTWAWTKLVRAAERRVGAKAHAAAEAAKSTDSDASTADSDASTADSDASSSAET